MAYVYMPMGSGARDDATGGRIYPILPYGDDQPISDPPSIDTIERENPSTSAGSGDVLITHSFGTLRVTADAASQPGVRITPTGEHDNHGSGGWTTRQRGFYLSGFYVYQSYSAEYNRDSAARAWSTIVCRNESCTVTWSSYPVSRKTVSRSRGYNYQISNSDHPYAEWPEDVLAEQLAECIAAAPPPGTTGDDYLDRYYRVSGVQISADAHYLDPNDLAGYWRSRAFKMPGVYSSNYNGGFTQAYYQAISKLPQLEQNLFQNILETVSLIRSFADGLQASDLTKLENWKSMAQDAWLGYRYQYMTTVSDLEEISSALMRLDSLLSKRYVRSYGVGHEGNIICHCAVVVDMGVYIGDLKTYLKRINLRPTLYNLWDMVPYSFVVDWFINVGDILHALQEWLDAPTFPVTEVWYSFNAEFSDRDGARTRMYGRWRGSAPSLPYIDVSSASNRTLIMRIADTVSLFF